MKFRKIAGIAFIVLGALNLLDLGSPWPIPTVGLSALIIGGLCIVSGLALISPPGSWKERLRSLFLSEVRPSLERKPKIDPIVPVKVLKLAAQKSGSLTVSTVAMSLDISLDLAQAALDELVRKGTAEAEVDLGTGITTYTFPEFLPKNGSGNGSSDSLQGEGTSTGSAT
jgi:hypothetical protein